MDTFGRARSLVAFHATFVCMGLATAASAWIFWQLSPRLAPGEHAGTEPAEVT